MNKKQYSLTVALALIAGLVGGMVSSQFFAGQPVFAEKKAPHEKVVRAEKFEVVNGEGEVLARLRQDAGVGVALEFVDTGGAKYMELSGGLGMDGLWFHAPGKDGASAYYQQGGFRTESKSGGIWLQSFLGRTELRLIDSKGRGPVLLAIEENGAPFIRIAEFGESRHQTVIGHTTLTTRKTGEKRTRNASSIVMLDNEGTVIWKAP